MEVISQRELRNNNAEIVRGVERGDSYVVTRRGVPVAHIVPLARHTDLPCERPARRRPAYRTQQRVRMTTATGALLDDLRGDR